jgi:hypothetical protein
VDPRIRKHLMVELAKHYVKKQPREKNFDRFAGLAYMIQCGHFSPHRSDSTLVDNFVLTVGDFDNGCLVIRKKWSLKGLAPLLATEIATALTSKGRFDIEVIEVQE